MEKSRLPVAVSSIPDAEVLRRWADQGCDRWISVCGVGVADVLGEDEAALLPGCVFRLADPFSMSAQWQGEEIPNRQIFLAEATPALRNNLRRAVHEATSALLRGERIVVYCHRGQSRSPLVAAAALMLAFRQTPLEAWDSIADQFEVGPLSELGLSALVWLQGEFEDYPE